MMNKSIPSRIFLILGTILLLGGVCTLIIWQWNIRSSAENNKELVETILATIPNPQGKTPEVQTNNTMPTLSLEGADFVGVLEMPKYGLKLPVCALWGNTATYPRLFSGSVYDRSIKIGANSQNGQFDFYREISVGDTVTFTDMEGNLYQYTISDLSYEKHATKENLNKNDADLTLFIKNEFAFEYFVIFCTL